MDKSQVTDILEEIAVLLELKGENPFKALAYTKAARTLDNYDGDLAALVAGDQLGTLPGVGEALRLKITELVKTGRLEYYENLRASVPAGLLELFHIPALGQKKMKALDEKLGVSSIAELEAACQAHRVRDLAGFGEKTEEKILAGIAQSRNYAQFFLYAEAWAWAENIREALRDCDAVSQVSVAGSIRRGREVVKDLDFLASSRTPAEVMDYFISLPGVKQVTNHGPTKSSVLFESGIAADLRVVSDKEFVYALHHFTGSKEHNVAMRQRAIAQGRKMSEWGLFEIKPGKKKGEEAEGKLVPCRTEDDLFAALGLQYIPPELRENLGEIEVAEKKQIPRLVDWTQLRGTFHCHTTASDGKNTLREMAEAARELGLDYLGIADHSKSSFQANGLDEERLVEQIESIAQLNAELKDFHVFSGSEVDILKDGRLDFVDKILGQARLRRRVGAQRLHAGRGDDDGADHPRDGKRARDHARPSEQPPASPARGEQAQFRKSDRLRRAHRDLDRAQLQHVAHGHGLALVASRARQRREMRDQSRRASRFPVREPAPRRHFRAQGLAPPRRRDEYPPAGRDPEGAGGEVILDRSHPARNKKSVILSLSKDQRPHGIRNTVRG